MEKPLLEVRNLSKTYSTGFFGRRTVTAVDNVSLRLDRGETLALVGESGCGKSTLGRCLLRLTDAYRGKIFFKGVDFRSPTIASEDFRRKAQMIFQDSQGALNPRKRVAQLVLEPLKIHKMVRGWDGRKLSGLLKMAGLPADTARRYPHELSGGQRQRVVIARAMALVPEFIVADEPTASLDLLVQAQILELMKRFQEENGVSYLFISHDLKNVKIMADRIAVMYLGQLVESGRCRTLLRQPLHPYTQALFSAVATTAPGRQQRIVLKGEIPSALNPPAGCKFHTRCPQARSICAIQPPPWEEVAPGHFVRCHNGG